MNAKEETLTTLAEDAARTWAAWVVRDSAARMDKFLMTGFLVQPTPEARLEVAKALEAIAAEIESKVEVKP